MRPFSRSLGTQGNCIRATVLNVNYYPFSAPRLVGNKIKLNGLSEILMATIYGHLNQCYNVTMLGDTVDGGNILPNGSFTGLMGLAERKETDIVIGPFAYSYERQKVLDFSVQTDYNTFGVVYKYPEIEPDIAGFIKPFLLTVWILVFLSFAVIVWMFVLSSFVFYKLNRRNWELNFITSSLNAFGLFFSQSIQALKVTNHNFRITTLEGDRLILGIWLLASFIVTLVYKSNLMAMLTTPKLPIPFETLEQVVNQNKLPIGVKTGTIIIDIMKSADKNSVLGKLNSTSSILLYTPYKDLDAGKVAFVVPANAILGELHRQFSQLGHCKYTIMKEQFLGSSQGYVFPKNSPLKEKFNQMVVRLKESGIMDHWMANLIGNSSKCLNPKYEGRLRALAFGDFYGVFILLLSGYGLSLLVFIGELLVKRYLYMATKMNSHKRN